MLIPVRISLIGFGEVGRIFARDLSTAGVPEIRVHDSAFTDPTSTASRAADNAPIVKCATSAQAVEESSLVISAVTAGSAESAAETAVRSLAPNAFYVDVNSVSPGAKQAIGNMVSHAGGRFVEAAIMTSIPAKGLRSAMLLGGVHAQDFMALMTPFDMDTTIFSSKLGEASAVKMCRSVIIKGMETLLLESLVSARHYGVEQQVLASLTDTIQCDWPALARYMSSRALIHGRRRAEEVREVARTVMEAGLTPFLADGIAKRQDWAADHGMPSKDATLVQILDWLQSAPKIQH